MVAKNKSPRGANRAPKKIEVELIPSYESMSEFQKRKDEVQEIIAKMIILGMTRGRPRKDEQEDFNNAA
ncbi:MAG TPA: hypothetical protein VI754_11365 [Bacteriovoracaceae bacterium]|nr:hypothetical protein [Bacteriovoracaceae bacterium]